MECSLQDLDPKSRERQVWLTERGAWLMERGVCSSQKWDLEGAARLLLSLTIAGLPKLSLLEWELNTAWWVRAE